MRCAIKKCIQYYCYGCSINKTDFPVVKVYVTDFPVLKVHVDELSSARIWHHKLCTTLSANVNINYRLSHQSILSYLYCQTYQNRNNSWKPECVLSLNMGWRILVFNPEWKHYHIDGWWISFTQINASHIYAIEKVEFRTYMK